ncbi:hypothetical protein [Actinomadura latina]|uniref:Uncharacterized protein n=1 Tax=Actinomadura latina TaxID=163603 RepID=A0A846ZAJ5_9ACTN|nr:hypothetical protein [Actinomadura latina]NKZ07016.1 hypothetical protein [Actinomadura latina]
MATRMITETGTALGHLDRLTDALRGAGWAVEVAAPGDRLPSALVADPHMRRINESVIAAPEGTGGAWSYFYGWGERIAPCTDAAGAAATLGRVLTARRDN